MGGRNELFIFKSLVSPCEVAAEWLPLRPKATAAAKTVLSTCLSFPKLP